MRAHQVENLTCTQIIRLARRLEFYLEKDMQESLKIGLAEFRLMVNVYEFGNLDVNVIADAVKITISQTVEFVVVLERFGYVERPLDRLIIKPTPEGEEAYHLIAPKFAARQQQLLNIFSDDEADQLNSLLSRLFQNTNQLIEEQGAMNE